MRLETVEDLPQQIGAPEQQELEVTPVERDDTRVIQCDGRRGPGRVFQDIQFAEALARPQDSGAVLVVRSSVSVRVEADRARHDEIEPGSWISATVDHLTLAATVEEASLAIWESESTENAGHRRSDFAMNSRVGGAIFTLIRLRGPSSDAAPVAVLVEALSAG